MPHIGKNEPIHFHATYNYGDATEQIKKKNPIVAAINSLVVRLFKFALYPGISILKKRFNDPERVEKGRTELISLGAEVVKMKTPDGTTIDGLHLSANDFKAKLGKYFDLNEPILMEQTKPISTKVEVDKNGKPVQPWGSNNPTVGQSFRLKPEYASDPLPQEAEDFINLLKNMGAPISKLNILTLDALDKTSLANYNKKNDSASEPTVLITAGAGVSCMAYKGLALTYLFRGLNVMMVDFRGYGKSRGSPTEHRTKLDLETAYQYLHKEKGVKNEDLVVHGYCLGGGPASDLAARRKGVNLILDRSFAEYREAARSRFPRIGNILYRVLPWIVNYNNAENIAKTEGHIAVVRAKNDEVIKEDQTFKSVDSFKPPRQGQVRKLMHSEGEHADAFHKVTVNKKTTVNGLLLEQFDAFLMQTGLYRGIT